MRSTVERVDTEELLRIVGGEAPTGICLIQNGSFRYLNSNFPIATGYRADELMGRDSLVIVAPEDKEMVRENTVKMLRRELHSPYQFRVIHKNGSIVWVMAAVRSVQYRGARAILGSYMEVTDRKQAEERIRDSEERHRLLAENIADVIWTVNVNCPTRLTYVSPSVTRLLGYTVEESMAKEMKAVFTPMSLVTAMKAFAEEIGDQRDEHRDPHGSRRLELQLIHKNGALIDVEVNFSLIRGANGQEDEILAVARDITRRKQMQGALLESEERYKELANSITDIFFAADEHLICTYWNKASEILTGIREAEAIGKSLTEILPDTPGVRSAEKLCREALRTQQAQAFVMDCGLSGRRCIFEVSAYPSRGGISVFGRDISERRRTEETLEKSEERYRTFTENAGEAIFVVQDGMIKFMNPQGEELSGYTLKELASRPFVEFIYPDDINMVVDRYARRLKGEPVPQRYEFRIVRRDGTIRWGELGAVTISWEDEPAILCFMNDVTERKEAADTLKQSEGRYRTILDEMGDGYFETDLAGSITFANDALLDLLGYSRDEIVGMNSDAFRPKGQRKAVFRAYNRVYKTGQPLRNFPSEIICKDGRHVFAETSAFPIRNDNGEIIGFRGIRHDITERKQAEEALRQSEERYRTILEEMEDAYFETDLGGHLTFVNDATCRSLGYSEEELVGMSYRRFTVEEDIEAVFRAFNEVYRTGVPNKGFCWRIMSKHGTLRLIEHSAFPLRNDKGEIAGFRGVGHDITEQKQAEEKLRQSEENYKTLFDSSVIGMVLLDAETMTLVMVNQAAAKMFGFSSAQEGIGVNPVDFILADDRERVTDMILKEVFEQDLRQPRELRASTRDGRQIWISVTGARIIHEGRLAGLISFMDITEQQRQRERLMMTDRLASLGELAAGAAHELNNPLTSIIGFSQLLIEKEMPEDIREEVKLIYSEAQRAASVTKNLLTFARKRTPVKQPNQINAIIENVLQLRAHAQETDRIEVRRHLAGNLPEVMVDYFQMQQVLLNIIINAEYFMTKGRNRGTLEVCTKQQNGSVLISIADDGPGIPPENLARIFDPFFTTKEPGKGTGLGLSICHGIVTEHGGQIYVRSQLGKGTTVFVELPINHH